MGMLDGKRPLEWPSCRWEDNIKMDLGVVSCEAGDCIDLTQNRVQWRAYVRAVMNLRVP